jgi:hypothetical protein
VPAFEVVLVRTVAVLDELVVGVEVTAGDVVTVAVVLALTPASEQYCAD